jgi:AsmA protein
MRILKLTGIAFVAIFAAALLFLVVGVPADFLVDTIRTRFAAETGYQLQISGGVELGLWPAPSIVVRDITLLNAGDDAPRNLLTVASARLEVSFASLISGQPKIAEFVLVHPVVRVPLVRRAKERNASANAQPSAASKATRQAPDIGRVVVEDGSVLLLRSGDDVESRVDHINITAALTDSDHRLDAKIDAKLGSQALQIQIKSKAPIEKREQSVPLEISVEAPGLLLGTLSSTANVTSIDSLVKINDLEGMIGKDRFTGWASVDLASKPRVKVDLDFKRLSLAATPSDPDDTTRPSTLDQPWSDQKFDLDGLNYVDAQVAFSASLLEVSSLRLAPVYVEAALVNGVLNLAVSNTGLYGGKCDGIITLDVSAAVPRQTISMNLNGVRALPLLSTFADFRELDGTMRGKIDVQATGASQRAIMSTLGGTVDVLFQDGQIRNMNVAQMVRTLAQNTLNGWQENKAEKTDLTELSTLFKLDSGRATTDNLKLLGPLIRVNGAGTADLAAKTLHFKLDTKLVMSIEGQGGAADPVGFGVPVMVDGKWGSPRIYPDMAGILENPDAAYAKLRDLGVGLFGNNNDKSAIGADSFVKGLGNLFGNQGSDHKDSQAPAAGDKQSQPQDTQSKVNDFLKNIFGR